MASTFATDVIAQPHCAIVGPGQPLYSRNEWSYSCAPHAGWFWANNPGIAPSPLASPSSSDTPDPSGEGVAEPPALVGVVTAAPPGAGVDVTAAVLSLAAPPLAPTVASFDLGVCTFPAVARAAAVAVAAD
jgi:hypothetical protein